MSSNIKTQKPATRGWRWFVGLYFLGLVIYGVVEVGLHYLNVWLTHL